MSQQASLFDVPAFTALSTWRLCLPCAFGARASWDAPSHAIGWYGAHHCYHCASAVSALDGDGGATESGETR